MEIAILTVGDEVLSGDVPNSNAARLANQLTDSGATVVRILTVPDERDLISDTVTEWSEAFDAVIVTGGLGGTHDDVTAPAIADAFDCDLVVDDSVREDVIETVAAYRDANPETISAYDLEIDVDAWAALPEDGRPLINPEGLCPGCVIENVYAFPGVPQEMQALFEQVSAEFKGEITTRTLYTPQPEGSMVATINDLRDRFDVTVGSYPETNGQNRLKVSGTDAETVAESVAWLRDRIEIDSVE